MQISQLNTNAYTPVMQGDVAVSPRSGGESVTAPTVTVEAVPQQAVNPVQKELIEPGSVERATEQINDTLKLMSTNVQFMMDKDTGKSVIKVMDMETNTLIRQMPSAEVLAIAKALDRLQGLILRDKV